MSSTGLTDPRCGLATEPLASTLVRDYHARVVDQGVRGYTFDDLWRDYCLGHMASTAVPVQTGGITVIGSPS